jgi:hypothetical protein
MSQDRWAAVAVDDIDAIDWRRTGLNWLPLRAALGANVVGMAAFRADRAGDCVVEPHVEDLDGRGHQEIYVVMRGRARFMVDGAEFDAAAGTLVRVDPEAHRRADALTDDTIVLALGGPPSFEPSASEWIERARPHIRSDPERARAILDDLRRELPADRGNDVGTALLAIGAGDSATARAIVTKLVAEEPLIVAVLRVDPDLRGLLPD